MPIRSSRFWPLLLLLAACARTPHSSPGSLPNKYTDATIRRIGTAQDERNTAALLPFLTNSSPAYRREAALALASVQAPAAVPGLVPLLRDADPTVRRAAAYALGQTGDSTAVDSLRVRVLQETDGLVRRYVHEALGRTVTRHSLPELWRVEILSDTSRAAALAWGLNRAALRGLASSESIRRTVALLNLPKLSTAGRLAAVTGFLRTRGLDADLKRLAETTLLRVAVKDRSYAVRAAAAGTLGKIAAFPLPALAAAAPGVSPAAVLAQLAVKDRDYRVRLSAIRALPFEANLYPTSRAAVFYALRHDQAAVALTAAEWILAHARGESATALLVQADRINHWRARYMLQAAAIRVAGPAEKESVSAAVFHGGHWHQLQLSEYQIGAQLQALSENPSATNYALVKKMMDPFRQNPLMAKQSVVVAGYCLAALLAMRRNQAFPTQKTEEFEADMRQGLASGDVAQIGTAAEALADPKLYPEARPADLTALRAAQARLVLPREIEAWQGIQQALDKLEKAPKPTPSPLATAAQHPIDWAVVQGVPLGQQVRLRTSRGIILLELKPNEAPGAVASFVTLIGQHFYDGLYFHRVVPNFVAQGGDPRGDGNGSAPYNLRSEFGDLRYEAGSVGLASAGKDTESCQFFITHTPTPHLDGRYPIFAQVVGGMDVVHRLEIGDRILGVELVLAK